MINFRNWIDIQDKIVENIQPNIISDLSALLSEATPLQAELIINLCLGTIKPITHDFFNSNLTPLLEADKANSKLTDQRPTIEYVYRELIWCTKNNNITNQDRLNYLLAELDDACAKGVKALLNNEVKIKETILFKVLALKIQSDADEILTNAYNSIADLGFIARLLWKHGEDYLKDIGPIVGIPVHPESQTRFTHNQLSEIWEDFGPCFVHTKYDGFRCQIHKNKDLVKLFLGRNLTDVTDRFPDVVRAARIQIDAETAILDSEMIPYDHTNEKVLPRKLFFQSPSHKLIIFDVIFLNGEDWRKYPYAERHAIKTHIIQNQVGPGIMDFSKDKFVVSREQLNDLSNECIRNEEEGFIVIRSTALYQSSFSGLRSKDRLKIKSIDPVDAVLIGYDLSKKNKNAAETFLLAVYDGQNNEFVTFSKAVSGLTLDQNIRLLSECQKLVKIDRPARVNSKIKPEVWLHPELVIELEVDFIYPSIEHTCGLKSKGIAYGAQHVKFITGEVRSDKSPEQATSVIEFLKIRQEPGMRLTKEGKFSDSNQPGSNLITEKQMCLFDV